MPARNSIRSMTATVRLVIILGSALVFGACAAFQPPNAAGPRSNEPLYPVLLTEDSHRTEATAAALHRLSRLPATPDGVAPQIQLVTATIAGLPERMNGLLLLPKVGATAVMTEEETRESLRRFINDWQELIGAEPARLSLVERVDRPDGMKVANYEQRPFRYPIRGNYGKLQINFAADRRVINLSSSCIPDADQIQTALSALNVRLKAEDAVQQLREKGLVYSDPKGNTTSFTVPTSSPVNALGLTTYILPSKARPDALEFHLAWEMELTGAPVHYVYVDAVNGDILAAE
jgi:hypothetical protein